MHFRVDRLDALHCPDVYVDEAPSGEQMPHVKHRSSAELFSRAYTATQTSFFDEDRQSPFEDATPRLSNVRELGEPFFGLERSATMSSYVPQLCRYGLEED